jgi:hypothetical protein
MAPRKKPNMEDYMKAKKITTVILVFLAVATITSPVFSGMKSDECSKAKWEYIDVEHDWSALNAEVGLMRQQLESLRGLRWETKVCVSVLDDAQEIINKKGSLTRADVMAFNARIPYYKGIINQDGTFSLNGHEKSSIKDARNALKEVLKRTGEDIRRIDKELKEKEVNSHILSQKMAKLEGDVERICREANAPNPWEQGFPRMAGSDIYDRYVKKEKRRQEEVESRTWSDLERAWQRKYYRHRYPEYPYAPYYHDYRRDPYPLYPRYPYPYYPDFHYYRR